MNKLLALAIWFVRQAFNIPSEDWESVKEWVNHAETLTSKTGDQKRAFVTDTLRDLFLSRFVMNLLIELAVALLRKA